ncbi:type I-E CRISPR-associated protein Cas5/CasD [Niveispirillum fermenti]|uniref:type I-E CRISPR-associated protein Cas5/CasD n=1 Tax=Niveispirillum fermenti TaxID=1233113 RepID=UPI003A85967E
MTVPAFPQLCFTLMAPYGAWGAASPSSATTAWKATELDPPKSAIVGLLGAAMGVERAALGPLAAALRVAVRTGIRPRHDPRPDYHTISRARRPEGRERWSRFEELRPALEGRDDSGAMLSKREYWHCGLWSVAVAATGAGADLAGLAAALGSPRWVLYAGRKSCMLGLPPDPALVTASGPVAALTDYGWPWERHPDLKEGALAPLLTLKAARREPEMLAVEEGYPGAPQPADGIIQRRISRRDQPDPLPLPGGRIYQRFHDRQEIRMNWPVPVESGEEAHA